MVNVSLSKRYGHQRAERSNDCDQESLAMVEVYQDMPDQSHMPIIKDQFSGIDPKCGSIKMIADQLRSIKINLTQ